MNESILIPSPNWFYPSVMAVSSDGWLIYGGPSKSICVCEPQTKDIGIIAAKDKYQAHVFFVGNSERIISVDLSPEWLEKKSFVSGTQDGTVKQWFIQKENDKMKIKDPQCHEFHKTVSEDLVGVGYSNATTAVSVGAHNNIVKWDLASNVTKVYNHFMKTFRATCMACSPHVSLQVAVGTKQGVVFLIDLHGKGKLLYKVRGQDDPVMYLSWCPKYVTTVVNKGKEVQSSLAERLQAIRREADQETEQLEKSGIEKNLPEDSFVESVVQEDDTFDIYKDHEHDEFGHKKYEPESIRVKVKKEEAAETDYLAECLKLKEEILRRKNQPEPSIESLVNALDGTHVESDNDGPTAQADAENAQAVPEPATSSVKTVKISCRTSQEHKHLLASIGKVGGVRIWSETGKLVATCVIPAVPKSAMKGNFVASLLWYTPTSLLVIDGRNQLLEINPLRIDKKNRLDWSVLKHLHKRGMYCIKTNAPSVQEDDVQSSDDWSVWTVAQDRTIIRYCMKKKKTLAIIPTAGGSVYAVAVCPYDAGRVAVSVGDGAVRVMESNTLVDDDMKLTPPRVYSYWQNVQGKVLNVAWHPTRENVLAYSTGESRVGVIDTSIKSESGRVLNCALSHGVYSLSWGEDMNLYASGGCKLVMYNAQRYNEDPQLLDITIEGQKWEICAVSWFPRGLFVGSANGGVALLTPSHPHTLIVANFVFSKMIHAIEWHPQQTSSSTEESPYKNFIAVTSLDKDCGIAIVEYVTAEDGSKKLTTWKMLYGHTKAVLQATWNPHREGILLSSSQDTTVRVWDVSTGICISIFAGHSTVSLGLCWMSQPQLADYVMTGGGEFCLRLWNINEHKTENFVAESGTVAKKRQRRKGKKGVVDVSSGEEEHVALQTALTSKYSKPTKRFLLPIMFKQFNDPIRRLDAPRKMLQMWLEKNEYKLKENRESGSTSPTEQKVIPSPSKENGSIIDEKGDHVLAQSGDKAEGAAGSNEVDEGVLYEPIESSLDFIKIFGTVKEVNEFLDMEMHGHLEEVYHPEAYIMLSIIRGHIDSMIQFASERDMLCPFLLSMAPCVSFKYWKDATQLYLKQIDRVVARGEEERIFENKHYGGSKFRKAALQLSMHDVMGAVKTLCEGKLYKEAYILCRLRYMDSIADEIVADWAEELSKSGQMNMSAFLYIVMGNLSQAAQVLAKSQKVDFLKLAAEIAKIAGRTTFADHVTKKANQTEAQISADKTEEILKELPSKIDLLMKDEIAKACDKIKSDILNGETSSSVTLNGNNKTKE
ncbi:gem-associated protein 5-like [Spodoptera litura]|uniref:Gem-associated protein 5-like n=1 Tax=Spodoptera litura TaxID=69820 RepID=A0A9J7IW39_SPOLT|nr:gem-associated protein 5-like [Spodoptera litura]